MARKLIESNTWAMDSEATDGLETTRDRQIRRLKECAGHIFVVFVAGEPQLRFQSCRLRYCPRCAQVLSWKRSQLFDVRIAEMRRPSFLTLTMRHNDSPLRDQVQRLSRCWHKLKRRAVWKQCVRGGFNVVEIGRNAVTGRYHVHMHAIIDADFMPQTWISAEWLKITGDSPIVHIRRVKERDGSYLAKYTTKTGAELAITADELWDTIDAIRGLRLVGTFGNTRPLGDDEDVFPRAETGTALTCTIEQLYEWAQTDPTSAGYYRTLQGRHHWLPDLPAP